MVRYANVDFDVQDKSLYTNMFSEIHIIDSRSYQLNELSHGETWVVFLVLTLFSVALPYLMFHKAQLTYNTEVTKLRVEQGLN
jgi:hypothetical protein